MAPLCQSRQLFKQQTQGLGPVAARHFFFRAQLCCRAARSRVNKQRIVAETIVALRGRADEALPCSMHDNIFPFLPQIRSGRIHQGHAAMETPAMGRGAAGQDLHKLAVIALIHAFSRPGGPIFGIAGGSYARRAIQGVHFQPGIVRQSGATGQCGGGSGFEQGVFRKSIAGLVNFRGVRGQGLYDKTVRGQRSGQLPDFTRIAGGQNKRGHSNSLPMYGFHGKMAVPRAHPF